MSRSKISGMRIVGVASCVPKTSIENSSYVEYGFTEAEIRKVSSLAGVKRRRVSNDETCSSDLCVAAAEELLPAIGWEKDSIDGLIMVTQSPDHLLPSTSCLIHERLGLNDQVAAFDLGLGCSGYPYGLYLAAAMLKGGGLKRILLLHGETPSRFASREDRATALLFGDAGSATALEFDDSAPEASYVLQTDGSGANDLIIPAGGFRQREPAAATDLCVQMDGTGIFNFTLKRVPALIRDTLEFSGCTPADIDHYIFHQSNQFIMKHLMKKCDLEPAKVPLCLDNFGNTGGPSVPLALTQCLSESDLVSPKRLMLLGYGVGLSWASALVTIDNLVMRHVEY